MSSSAISWFGGPSPRDGGDDLPRVRRLRIVEDDAGANRATGGDAEGRALLDALAGGDTGAFRRLYDTYAATLWEFTAYLLRDADAARDVVQDVFASLWERRETLDVRDSLRAYLYRAVRNHVSKRRRHAVVVRRMEDGARTLDAPRPTAAPDPTEQLDADALERAVDAVILEMPESRRMAATLRLRHGLTDAEAAAVMGLSVDAVRMHVSRARAALRPLVARFRDA